MAEIVEYFNKLKTKKEVCTFFIWNEKVHIFSTLLKSIYEYFKIIYINYDKYSRLKPYSLYFVFLIFYFITYLIIYLLLFFFTKFIIYFKNYNIIHWYTLKAILKGDDKDLKVELDKLKDTYVKNKKQIESFHVFRSDTAKVHIQYIYT